jgi:hypothetical protein
MVITFFIWKAKQNKKFQKEHTCISLNKNALKHFVYGRDPHTINNKYTEHRKKKD